MARVILSVFVEMLCITSPTYFPHYVVPHHVVPHHVSRSSPCDVFPPPRSPPPRSPSPRISPTTYSPTTYPDLHLATTTTTETDELLHDTTCFWSATDSNRIIIIIYLARPLTNCGRDIWNCSKVNFLF